MNKVFLLSLAVAMLAGCSSTKVIRRADNDPMMRVIIAPDIDAAHYVQIKAALVESGKFEVIDRRDGFLAAMQEQDLQFRSGYQNRFSDREKYAHIGKMYGAMGIITASAQCYQNKNWRGIFTRNCKQFLTFINGVTGKIEFSVRGENSEPWTVEWTVPDWDGVIAKAVQTYPEFFEPRVISKQLQAYQDQSEELSKRAAQERQPAQVKTGYTKQQQQADFSLLKSVADKQVEENENEH